MISFIFLLISIIIIVNQIKFDGDLDLLSPTILFQIYFIIQSPLNLFIGQNFKADKFISISPASSTIEIFYLGSLMMLFQISFIFFYYIFKKRSNYQVKNLVWNIKFTNYVCLGTIVLGYAAFFALIQINGGFEAFQAQREFWRTAGMIGQGWVIFPATTLVAIAVCALCINNVKFIERGNSIFYLAMLYLVAVIPAYQLGFRSFILLPMIQMIAFYHIYISKIKLIRLSVSGLLFVVAFTLYGMLREVPYNAGVGSFTDYFIRIYYYRPELMFGAFNRVMGADVLQLTVEFVARYGDYKLFYPGLIEALTIPIPHALWEGKPDPLSVKFSQDIININGGISPTIVGEGYWHGGVIGIILIAFFVSIFMIFYNSLINERRNSNKALLALSIFPYLIIMAEAVQGNLNLVVLILIANLILTRIFAFVPSNGRH